MYCTSVSLSSKNKFMTREISKGVNDKGKTTV